jgi:hypothetical protein
MNKIYCLAAVLFYAIPAMAQPYQFIQPINPADAGLVSSPARRVWNIKKAEYPIIIDGNKDADWDLATQKMFDRFIMCQTTYTAGVYSCQPASGNRTPDNNSDFSGSCRITYDDDYLYAIYDITDNEVNDGIINPGIQERLELMIAPYSDSAQQMLQGKPFPPFSGVAPDINKKFCYWNYLGAFKFNFFLSNMPIAIVSIDERPDAVKINYDQRVPACQAKWQLKMDGSGYILEVAISLKVSLADSANNPFPVPADTNIKKTVAFDVKVLDRDLGMNYIRASWNALDDCVWDNMLYTGKMIFNGSSGSGCSKAVPSAGNVAICSGKTATLTATGGKNYRWYNSSTGGSPIATTAVYITPVLYSGTTYYVSNYDSCESSRKAVTVSIISNSSVKINTLKNNHFVCNSYPEQLSATVSGGTFSGDGVESGYFVPSQSKINHINSIYYTIGDSASGCQGKDSLHVFVFPCAGLGNDSENRLRIFPNPSSGIITIEVNEVKEEISLQLLDELGRVIFEDQKSGIENYSIKIDLSANPAGVYIVRAGTNDKIITSKIIKK